jgi:predicted PurR-regulated permease PerM
MAWVEQNAAGIAAAVGRTAVGGSATALAAVLGTFVSVGTVLFMLLLTLFFFFFLCTAWGRVVARGEKFIPHHDKFRWLRIIRQMDRVIAGFVRGRLTICAILALYMTAAYWAIGVPAWLILGPLVGMLFIVPFIHGLGVPVAMLLMWLQAGDSGGGFREEWWWIVFAPIGVYLVAQFLDDWVLTPIIQGNNTDMDTPTILFASIAGGSLAGVYGLLLAIPVAACIKILAREFLWPRVDAWVKGYEQDFLPIGRE